MRNRTSWLQLGGSLLFLSIGLSLCVVTFSGCGGKKGNKTETSSKGGDKKGSNGGGNGDIQRNNGGVAAAGRPRRGVWKKNGQKYWNNHPYDIWYSNAYAVAGEGQPVGSTGTGKTIASNTKKKGGKEPAVKKAAAKSSGDWKSIISGELLDEEMKRISNKLKEKTLTVARFNDNGYKEIQISAATLSAIAHVAFTHPDKISWKADALYLRDLGLKLYEKADARGKKKYDAAKVIYEQIDGILKRNKPAGLKEPKEDETFFDFTSRGGLMRRMSAAYKWLKAEIKTDEKFKAEKQMIVREATILGLLAKVIGDKSYDSADDPDYMKHVSETIGETQKIISATKTGNFAVFEPAVDKIYNNCNECHDGFRGQ